MGRSALKSLIDKSDMGMNYRFGRLLPPLTIRKWAGVGYDLIVLLLQVLLLVGRQTAIAFRGDISTKIMKMICGRDITISGPVTAAVVAAAAAATVKTD